MTKQLASRVVLATGTSPGICEAIARTLMQHGDIGISGIFSATDWW